MERVKDSIQTSCSSPFTSSSTGLPFKRRPTCQTNEGNGHPDLFKDTVMLPVPDRAARKEMERQRLRKLLNQGKKKRRRLNGDKLIISPTPLSYCHSREPELKPSGLSPAMPICGHVPRKSRSVGNRRRGKSWRSIGLDLQVQLPIPSAPTVFEKSSTPVQDEIEFEIAEVLYGLKKQVSSSDGPLIDDLEKIPVENEENQSISVQGCSVDKASSYYTVKKSKAESISTGPKLGIHNHDKAVIKQETSTAEERSFLCSNLASNGVNLTSEGISATLEETERKQLEKFVIDLNMILFGSFTEDETRSLSKKPSGNDVPTEKELQCGSFASVLGTSTRSAKGEAGKGESEAVKFVQICGDFLLEPSSVLLRFFALVVVGAPVSSSLAPGEEDE